METLRYLTEYYNGYTEDGRLASRHGSVEFLTTMRYIRKYIKPGDRVLEIGAGTGRYSHALAGQGYAVDAVELIEHNINIFRQKTVPGTQVSVLQGNAMDLSGFADSAYGITLLLGPLYHLFTAQDKHKAISEALRVTKPGGVVFAAYIISDASVLFSGFMEKRYALADFIKNGAIDPQTFAARSAPELIFELVRREDIDALMRSFSVKRLHYVATDGHADHMREALDAMDDAAFDLFMRYHFATCERADMAGLSSHTLDIFTKE